MVRVGRRQADDDTDRHHAYPDGIPAGELHAAPENRNREWRTGEGAAPEPGGGVARGHGCDATGGAVGDAGEAGAGTARGSGECGE